MLLTTPQPPFFFSILTLVLVFVQLFFVHQVISLTFIPLLLLNHVAMSTHTQKSFAHVSVERFSICFDTLYLFLLVNNVGMLPSLFPSRFLNTPGEIQVSLFLLCLLLSLSQVCTPGLIIEIHGREIRIRSCQALLHRGCLDIFLLTLKLDTKCVPFHLCSSKTS